MNTKFKVGDKVKITAKTNGCIHDGKIGTIERIDSPYGYDTMVKFPYMTNHSFDWFTQGELILVPEFENAI